MVVALAMAFVYAIFCWLFFFKFKVRKFTPAWGVCTVFIGGHVALFFFILLRFNQPYSIDATIIRRTIQLVPRLPEPTLLTEVLVKPNVPVKKGDPLFRFDDRLYTYQVNELKASLAAAEQNVKVLQVDIEAAEADLEISKSQEAFATEQVARFEGLTKTGAARVESLQQWQTNLASAQASIAESRANVKKARLAYESDIDGVNTQVAEIQAKLQQAEYYLEQTTIYAPEDGFVINLQARPGLVVGTLRMGAIASFICDEDPYVLAPFWQEHLKYVKPGQDVEVALDFYPGYIFNGKVEAIWWATGQGQMTPSANLPEFGAQPIPKGKFAVQIRMDADKIDRLSAGGQGAVAIYTGNNTSLKPFRKIEIRAYSWGNWLYPLPF